MISLISSCQPRYQPHVLPKGIVSPSVLFPFRKFPAGLCLFTLDGFWIVTHLLWLSCSWKTTNPIIQISEITCPFHLKTVKKKITSPKWIKILIETTGRFNQWAAISLSLFSSNYIKNYNFYTMRLIFLAYFSVEVMTTIVFFFFPIGWYAGFMSLS